MRIRTNPQHIVAISACAAIFALVSANLGFGIASSSDLSSDRKIILAVTMAATFAAVFTSAHFVLQRMQLSHRLLYAASGAVGMITALIVFADGDVLRDMIASGAFVSGLVFPAGAGWLLGSFYHWSAGLQVEDDDPRLLEQAMHRPGARSPAPGGIAIEAADQDPAFVETAQAGYYSGPVQVRTSLNAAVISSAAAVLLSHVTLFFFLIGSYYTQNGDAVPKARPIGLFGIQLPDLPILASALVSVLESGVMISLILAIPTTLIVYALHLGLRAFKKSDYLHYALVGLLTPPAIGLLLFFVLPLGLQLALPFAVAMMLYRKMAGLEPLSLPGDMEVRDRRTLIGGDHARRRYARVIDRS